jgi:hypothetical protein
MQLIGTEFVDLAVILVQICPRICGNVPHCYGPCNIVCILIIFSMFHSLCGSINNIPYGAYVGYGNKLENTYCNPYSAQKLEYTVFNKKLQIDKKESYETYNVPPTCFGLNKAIIREAVYSNVCQRCASLELK